MILQAFMLKFKMLTFVALLISPFAMAIDKILEWQEVNVGYAILVLTAVAIDHILGTVYHAFWTKDFCFKKNVKGLVIKLLIVVSVGYLFEGLNMLMEDATFIVDYTLMTLRVMVFLYPAGSAFSNTYVMTNKKFPPMGFMEWLKRFTENAPKNKEKDSLW